MALEAAPNISHHHSVSCDECGQQNLTGIRYKSNRIIDYDICEECYEENHKNLSLAGAFTVIREETTIVDDEDLFENPESLQVDHFTWNGLSEELRSKPRVQNMDLTVVFSEREFSENEYKDAAKAIKTSSSLKSFYFDMHIRSGLAPIFQERNMAAVTTIINACTSNTSIVTLSIGLNFALAMPLMEPLCGLLRKNKNLKYVFVRDRPRRLNFITLQNEEGHQERAIAAAIDLFRALVDSSVHSFVCMTRYKLGEECREAALHAMRTNPSLKRIKADIQRNESDDELDQLVREKKQHWMRDWNDLEATNESRVMILDEVLNCKQVEDEDQVAALFHFIRGNPGSIPQRPNH